MPFHHVAVAARDMPAIDAFYSEAMGFELQKVEIAPTPAGGWAKHFFYDTGNGEMMAFWELHDETIGEDYKVALSTDMGMPPWVNHISFLAHDLDDLAVRRQRWLDHGYDVLEIDHGWCVSLYFLDPNGIMVEFCRDTEGFAVDPSGARALLDTTDATDESTFLRPVDLAGLRGFNPLPAAVEPAAASEGD